MRKLIVQEWLTLDGYAADKDGELFFVESKELNKYADYDVLKFLESIDTILLGAVTYKLFVDFWPTATTGQELIADKLNETDKIIFSNTITHAPWGKWKEATVINGDAVAAVRKLKQLEGKDMILWGSISLAQSLMKENLIDEYHINICPLIIGQGLAFFPNDIRVIDLELLEMKKYDSGLIVLKYRSKKTS